MTDYNYADITIIMDRSGSMDIIQQDAQGGINEFIKTQAQLSGKKVLTVVAFDNQYEVPVPQVELHPHDYPRVTLQPRGSTALLDAIGKTIISMGERFRNMPEHQRPGKVLVFVVTDGQENSSKEFTKPYIQDMIKHQEDKYQWQFIYLGANQDGFSEGMQMGFKGSSAATYNTNNIRSVLGKMSSYTSGCICADANEYREVVTCGINFSDQDRSSFVAE